MHKIQSQIQYNDRIQKAVTPELIRSFGRDGAVCIRGALNSQELKNLKNGIEENLRSPSSRSKVASAANDPGRFFEDFCNWQSNESYRKVIFDSPLGGIAGQLMQSNTCRLYHDHLLVKDPGTRQATPWHQDQPYYNVDGKQNCSFWIPIDPVPRSSTLEFIAGSHLGPWLMPRSFQDQQAKWFPEGSLTDLPLIEQNRHQFSVLGWDLEPGDLVCFHMLTLHAASGVGAQQKRRVFSVRFLGDDMVHAPRPWITSPSFLGLENEIAPGAPLDHPLFPILWKKDG